MALNHKRMRTQLTPDLLMENKGSYDHYFSSSEMEGACIFFNSYPKAFMVISGKSNVKGYYDNYDDAKDFALSIIYKTNTEYIISQLNKCVDKLVSSAQQQMHLRLAEFRGNLFSQIQTLRS